MDTIVRVDRSIKPAYAYKAYDDIKKMIRVVHPEFEDTGPVEFDVRSLELWTHPDHPTSWGPGHKFLRGRVVYEFLKNAGLLSRCLNIRDLEEIEKKGVNFFRENFSDSKYNSNYYVLHGPKSAVEATDHAEKLHLYMPSLWVFRDSKYGSHLSMHWSPMCNYYDYQPLDRTPLFPKEEK